MKQDACPPPPAGAASLFGEDRLEVAERFAALLATDGVVRGLIGPREAPRLWDRHLVNCALLGRVLPADASVADIGAGAGLPGIVVAIARPDLRVTLVEPLQRRTTFLDEVVAAFGLANVTVHRGKADSLHGTATFDVVTSRAVAPMGRLLEWSMPLVAARGELIAMKGSSVADEIVDAREVLARLRCSEPVVETIAAPEGMEGSIQVARVAWADPSRVVRRITPTSGASTRPLGRGSGGGRRRRGGSS